jgi:hypothetical protein
MAADDGGVEMDNQELYLADDVTADDCKKGGFASDGFGNQGSASRGSRHTRTPASRSPALSLRPGPRADSRAGRAS